MKDFVVKILHLFALLLNSNCIENYLESHYDFQLLILLHLSNGKVRFFSFLIIFMKSIMFMEGEMMKESVMMEMMKEMMKGSVVLKMMMREPFVMQLVFYLASLAPQQSCLS